MRARAQVPQPPCTSCTSAQVLCHLRPQPHHTAMMERAQNQATKAGKSGMTYSPRFVFVWSCGPQKRRDRRSRALAHPSAPPSPASYLTRHPEKAITRGTHTPFSQKEKRRHTPCESCTYTVVEGEVEYCRRSRRWTCCWRSPAAEVESVTRVARLLGSEAHRRRRAQRQRSHHRSQALRRRMVEPRYSGNSNKRVAGRDRGISRARQIVKK